ncbi:hypothetical protein DBR06_SOUSAS1410073, partial [Sousa chinensis]
QHLELELPDLNRVGTLGRKAGWSHLGKFESYLFVFFVDAHEII